MDSIPKNAVGLSVRAACSKCGHEGQVYFDQKKRQEINLLMLKAFARSVGAIAFAAALLGFVAGRLL